MHLSVYPWGFCKAYMSDFFPYVPILHMSNWMTCIVLLYAGKPWKNYTHAQKARREKTTRVSGILWWDFFCLWIKCYLFSLWCWFYVLVSYESFPNRIFYFIFHRFFGSRLKRGGWWVRKKSKMQFSWVPWAKYLVKKIFLGGMIIPWTLSHSVKMRWKFKIEIFTTNF